MPECNVCDDSSSEESTKQELNAKAEKSAQAVMEKLKDLSLTLALAESCTAGLISSLLVNTNGASANFWGAFVCYMLEAKTAMLGLKNEDLLAHGQVSRETACSMAKGALEKSGADIAVAVTGFAGQNGDNKARGGTIWAAIIKKGGEIHTKEWYFTGFRNNIRYEAAAAVLEEIELVLKLRTFGSG